MPEPIVQDANEKMPPTRLTSEAKGELRLEEFSRTGERQTSGKPQPDYAASLAFLRAFHPDRRWILTSISTDKRSIDTTTFDAAREAACRAWLAEHGASRNIYFSVAEIDRDVTKKAERTDIARVHYLHVDVDPRAGEDLAAERERALRLLQNPPAGLPAPTYIVFSGGGYQGFWALAEPIAIDRDLAKAEDAKLYNLHLEHSLGGDKCHNVDRIMRLPGTINRPDPLKLKKGRTEALAVLIAHDPANVCPLGQFPKAQAEQPAAPGTAAPTVNVSGTVKRLASVDELPAAVSRKAKVVIVQGHNPDEPNKFSGRSEWLLYACCEMVRGGCDDDTIYSVITDPGFGISASVLDKGSMIEKYAVRQIARAREDAINPWLRKLNEQFAVISSWGGKCRVVEEQTDHALGRSRLTKQSFDDFRNRHMNVKVKAGTNDKGVDIMQPLGQWWLAHEHRRQYETIVFAPGRDVPNAYNLWQGFAVEPKPGDCSLFLAHLRDNICQGNEEHYGYLTKWMARAVQTPDSPGYAGVVLKGGQGTGKSFVAKTFGGLFGRHFMQVTDPKHLVGSFNAHLRDCVVLFGDEAFYAGDKKHESVLKMLVTEEHITVEAKGVDAEAAANCIHLLMASNESWVVPAAIDDRRFFVLEVGEAHKNDGVYFAAIEEQLNNGGRAALLHHLMSLDLRGFNVRAVPKTDALREQQARSANGLRRVVHDWFVSGSLPLGEKKPEPKRGRSGKNEPLLLVRIDEGQLLAYVNAALKARNERQVGTADVIEFLRETLGLERTRSNGSGSYYVLPPLEQCRRAWDAKLFPVPWAKYDVPEDGAAAKVEAEAAKELFDSYAAAGFVQTSAEPVGPEDLTGWRIEPRVF